MKNNSWLIKGVILGSVFFLAVLLVKPIGVSTQFSVLSGIFHSALDESVITENGQRESGYESSNAYYDKSEGKLAKAIEKPWNYDFVFVLAIPLGGFLAYEANNKRRSHMSDLGGINHSSARNRLSQMLPSFFGGVILLFGARMADGCTSGHMMSGMMQGSISGYLFAACVFAVAIPAARVTARMTGRRK
ncbi:MAG: hypothetical protein EOM66_10150 [Clostridia bacterium]|nr:hypothetical protein [Clostridia bacterium]